MRVVLHTSLGVFASRDEEVSDEDFEKTKAAMEQLGTTATYMTLPTEKGYMVIPGDVVRSSVLVVEA